MAERFDALQERHRDFVARQRVFFVASAARTPAGDSRVNVSPRPTDCLRVVDERTVCYLDRTGSGNETAAHALAGGRTTVMLCAFEGPPLILRLYGRARILRAGTPGYDAALARHFGGEAMAGARQIVMVSLDLVQTSCGYGVPLMDYRGERRAMDNWTERKLAEGGEAALEAYRRERNAASLDGLPTGVASAPAAAPEASVPEG